MGFVRLSSFVRYDPCALRLRKPAGLDKRDRAEPKDLLETADAWQVGVVGGLERTEGHLVSRRRQDLLRRKALRMREQDLEYLSHHLAVALSGDLCHIGIGYGVVPGATTGTADDPFARGGADERGTEAATTRSRGRAPGRVCSHGSQA
jgi:hypothetical protein